MQYFQSKVPVDYVSLTLIKNTANYKIIWLTSAQAGGTRCQEISESHQPTKFLET